MKETTLLLALRENQILLAMKKRGFGAGLFNGAGGKLEKDETVENAMIRETQEEIGITLTKYEKVAEIFFDEVFNKGEIEQIHMHVFTATEFIGVPTESEEMKPIWFDIDKIPFDKMFKDDSYWLPLVLAGEKVKARFVFDENFNVKSHSLEIIDQNKMQGSFDR